MLDAAVRLLSGFFEHPEHGINAMSASLPRANLGGAPPDAAPPVLPIFNDVDDASVAKELSAPQLPALIVFGDSNIEIELKGYKIARELTIAAAFVTDESVDDLVMNRACGYILRGGLLTMGRYNSQDKSAGFRELNGVKIHKIRSVTEQRVTAAVGRQKMWGFLLVRAIAVETYS